MRSKRIALIACANGLGHLRRMLCLYFALRNSGATPILIGSRIDAERLSTIYGVSMPEIIDFESKTKIVDWFYSEPVCWTKTLPDLSGFDEVISDNLIEVLELRPDAWLSGSFFWHIAIPNFPKTKARRAHELLVKYRPRMIASYLFAAEYLAEYTRLYPVGLFSFPGVQRESNVGNDILISCGRGGEALEGVTDKLIREIGMGVDPGLIKVWVEPLMHYSQLPNWMQPATFTTKMYGSLAAAVIRPGVGTLTDCLINGVRVFAFYESNNLEMRENASKIVKCNLGEMFSNPKDAWKAALAHSKRRQHLLHDSNRLNEADTKVDMSGAQEAVRILLGAKAVQHADAKSKVPQTTS